MAIAQVPINPSSQTSIDAAKAVEARKRAEALETQTLSYKFAKLIRMPVYETRVALFYLSTATGLFGVGYLVSRYLRSRK